jgi:SnoaL-like domain
MLKMDRSLLIPALLAIFLASAPVGYAWADDAQRGPHANHLANVTAPADSSSGYVQWDAQASRDLEAEVHRLHEIWNSGDIASLKKYIIGDSMLPTFELEPKTHNPIKLQSRADFERFIGAVMAAERSTKLVTELENPKVHCRATATWGICTEECSVLYKNADSGELAGVDKLWSTQIAVRTAEGWRWIQWHMSNARAPQSVKVN